MPSHKSEDYKIIAVKYHLENNSSLVNTCKIFKCNERSLKRWIDKYNNQHNITRNNRPALSYKITQEQVKDALQLLKQNEQITMNELQYQLQKRHKTLDISARQLSNILRDNNKTRQQSTRRRTLKKYKKLETFTKGVKSMRSINKDNNNSSVSIMSFPTENNSNLEDEIKKCDMSIVKFYINGCHHCENIKGTWKNMCYKIKNNEKNEKNENNEKLGIFDVEVNNYVLHNKLNHKITGVPEILKINKQNKEIDRFGSRERTLDELIRFANN